MATVQTASENLRRVLAGNATNWSKKGIVSWVSEAYLRTTVPKCGTKTWVGSVGGFGLLLPPIYDKCLQASYVECAVGPEIQPD